MEELWEAMRGIILLDRDEFERAFDGCEVEVFDRFIRVNKGPEFHFVSRANGSATKQDIRDCVQPIIDKYGHATTKTPIHDTRQQSLNRRIGFIETSRDENNVFFRSEKLKNV